MLLFTDEVRNMEELKEILKDNTEISKDYKVAVIAYTFDKDNKIIFQRRGPGCRDEHYKLETIGGGVKQSDIDFRSALRRELTEEVGTKAEIELEEFIVSTYTKTFDMKNNKEQDWVYLTYKSTLKDGELQIAEPEKNLGYERYKIGQVDEKELSNGAKELYNFVREKYKCLI